MEKDLAVQTPESAQLLPSTLKKGDPVWMIINGEPALRYYVGPHRYGHIVAWEVETYSRDFHEHAQFWRSESDVIQYLINGICERMQSLLDELSARRKQLAFALQREAENV